jgi:pimeloyl-ACP methyl ester carboxylesterase
MHVALAGGRVEARRIEGREPWLVYLHEGLGSARQWRDFPDEIASATGHAALVYSRLGYGDSDPVPVPRPLTYMQDEARGPLFELLDAAGIRSAILIGHSDGASIALVHAAIDGGHRVRGAVLEAPHLFAEDLTIASIERAREAYVAGDLREKLAAYHAHVDVAFWGWNRAWLDPRFREWSLEEYVPRVRVPLLVVQGDDDPYGTRAQVDAIARRASGPVDVLMLPRCAHAPHRDRREATRDAIVAFVGRVTGSLR